MNLKCLYLLIICSSLYLYAADIHVKSGNFNETITLNISQANEFIIIYNYSQTINDDYYLRAYVTAFVYYPNSILVIIKDDYSQVNYIKLSNKNNKSIVTAERTICPSSSFLSGYINQTRTLMVEVSTKSLNSIKVTLIIKYESKFHLELDETRSISIGHLSPVYFLFKFPSDTNNVNVIVESSDNVCMILSIQEARCPVYDGAESVKFQSTYQTVQNSGSMTIRSSMFAHSKMLVVFVLTNNGIDCDRKLIGVDNNDSWILKYKAVNVTIVKVPNQKEYAFPILIVIVFYAAFFIMAWALSLIYNKCCYKAFSIEITENTPINNMVDPFNHSVDEVADMETLYSCGHRKNYNSLSSPSSTSTVDIKVQATESDPDSFDHIPEISDNPDIYRLNKSLFVSDLSRKRSDVLDRKYFLYFWYLVIISVFYGLPVIQLVVVYQTALKTTGNEDTCYYNFKCTRPLFIFTAFNNIFSNVGYVLLGILFTMITYRRHRLYNECQFGCRDNAKHGIPQYYGLFYAMGLALTMEGVLSACYHICPSNSNFQFDTAFMYILACLCIIKIYQIRHPDVNASAHSFFMVIALIIFIGVIGVIYNSHLFWILFPFLYVIVFILISAEIYYIGRWRLDFGLFKRIYILMRTDRWKIFIPIYQTRMLVLIALNIMNFVIALAGSITRQSDFASYFLAIFMINLFLYFFFYIAMKIIHRESFHILTIIYIIIALICWALAVYCFANHPTEWQKTPAQSREENQNCLLLDFYDIHDVWHLLSSISMFFSFLALQNLDDGLFTVERDKIVVF